MPEMNATPNLPAVSVVVPVRNEAENVGPLADEIAAALTGRWGFEVVFVDDGSTDDTDAMLVRLGAERPEELLGCRHGVRRDLLHDCRVVLRLRRTSACRQA